MNSVILAFFTRQFDICQFDTDRHCNTIIFKGNNCPKLLHFHVKSWTRRWSFNHCSITIIQMFRKFFFRFLTNRIRFTMNVKFIENIRNTRETNKTLVYESRIRNSFQKFQIPSGKRAENNRLNINSSGNYSEQLGSKRYQKPQTI